MQPLTVWRPQYGGAILQIGAGSAGRTDAFGALFELNSAGVVRARCGGGGGCGPSSASSDVVGTQAGGAAYVESDSSFLYTDASFVKNKAPTARCYGGMQKQHHWVADARRYGAAVR